MPLPLTRTLKRELLIDGEPHTVTISPHGIRVTAKRFRIGRALTWREVLALGAEDGPPGTRSATEHGR